MDLRLKGKVAMVGGATGGWASRRRCAREGRRLLSMASSNDSSKCEAARKISVHGIPALATTVDIREGRQRSKSGGGRPSSGLAASTCCSRNSAALRPARCSPSTIVAAPIRIAVFAHG